MQIKMVKATNNIILIFINNNSMLNGLTVNTAKLKTINQAFFLCKLMQSGVKNMYID